MTLSMKLSKKYKKLQAKHAALQGANEALRGEKQSLVEYVGETLRAVEASEVEALSKEELMHHWRAQEEESQQMLHMMQETYTISSPTLFLSTHSSPHTLNHRTYGVCHSLPPCICSRH